MRLYKYVDEHIVDVLRDFRLKVTRISDLNDPFDCFPACFTGSSEEEIRRRFLSEEGWREMVQRNPELVGQFGGFDKFKTLMLGNRERVLSMAKDVAFLNDVFMKNINKTRQNAYVLSLSEVADDVLMWAHYARQNSGAVVELGIGDGPSLEGYLLKKVDYDDARPLVNPNALDSEVQKQFDKVFMTKSLQWAHEREWRLLSSKEIFEGGDSLYYLKNGTGTRLGRFSGY